MKNIEEMDMYKSKVFGFPVGREKVREIIGDVLRECGIKEKEEEGKEGIGMEALKAVIKSVEERREREKREKRDKRRAWKRFKVCALVGLFTANLLAFGGGVGIENGKIVYGMEKARAEMIDVDQVANRVVGVFQDFSRVMRTNAMAVKDVQRAVKEVKGVLSSEDSERFADIYSRAKRGYYISSSDMNFLLNLKEDTSLKDKKEFQEKVDKAIDYALKNQKWDSEKLKRIVYMVEDGVLPPDIGKDLLRYQGDCLRGNLKEELVNYLYQRGVINKARYEQLKKETESKIIGKKELKEREGRYGSYEEYAKARKEYEEKTLGGGKRWWEALQKALHLKKSGSTFKR